LSPRGGLASESDHAHPAVRDAHRDRRETDRDARLVYGLSRRRRAAPRGRWRVKGALQLWEWDASQHDLAFWLEPALSDEV